MDDMDPELCAQVYVDWEYRKKWDSYAIGEWVSCYLVKVVSWLRSCLACIVHMQ